MAFAVQFSINEGARSNKEDYTLGSVMLKI